MALIKLNSRAIPDDTVIASDIADGSISTAKLADDAVTGAKLYAENLGRRNLLINGDMTIAQRGTSAATTGGYYNIDRWNWQHGTDGGFSGTQSSDVPSGTGFTKSLLWTVTSADSSFSSGQFAYIRQTV